MNMSGQRVEAIYARLGKMLDRPQTHAEYAMPEGGSPFAAAVHERLARLLSR